MTFSLKMYPAFRLLLLMAAGIAAGIHFELPDGLFLLIMFLVSALSFLLIYFKRGTAAYYIMALTIGLYVSQNINSISVRVPDKIIPEMPALVEGRITEVLRKDSSYMRCIVQGRMDSKQLPALQDTRILMSITGLDKRKMNLDAGAVIFAETYIRTPRKASLATDFPEKQYCASLDCQWLGRASIKKLAIVKPAGGLEYYKEKARENVEAIISRHFSPETSGIMIALVTGDQTKIEKYQKDIFSLSGTAHVIAVSGLHVGILASILFFFLGFAKNRFLKFGLFVTVIGIYIVFTGSNASAVRAGIMATALILAYTWQRSSKPFNIISLTIVIMIIFTPELVLSAGFHLSIGSILGIAAAYGPARNFLRMIFKADHWTVNYILDSVAMTLAASIVVAPIVAYYFKMISLVSILTNIVVIPLSSLSLIFALPAIIFSTFSNELAMIYASASDLMIRLCQEINLAAIKIPGAYLEGGEGLYISILASVVMVYIIFSKKPSQVIMRSAAGIVCGLLCFYIINNPDKEKRNEIYPRDQVVAAVIPKGRDSSFILLAERKPHLYPMRDIALEKYILEMKGDITIGITGLSGQNLYDNIHETRKIGLIELSHDLRRKIEQEIAPGRVLEQSIIVGD